MSEIKTLDERLSGIDFSGNRVEVSTEEFAALNDEVSELRAAYEALQKELEETRNHQRPFHWRDQNDKLKAENAELKEELDRERMRLTACGVAALENTKDCVEKRISKDSPYYSGSYSSVCRAVDEEIRLRDESAAQAKRIAELEKDLVEWNEFKKIRDAQMQALRKQMS